MENKNTRGSEWRKWDLHIHTPESGMANEFSCNWDDYVKSLFKTAIKEHIAVLGITDYFTIDGYKKIRTEYLESESKLGELFSNEEIEQIKHILILPNIEFRIKTIIGNNRVNYHVIFSDKVSIQDIEENFLHELDFVYENLPFENANTRKLKKNNIEKLGEKVKNEQSGFSGSDFNVGCTTAVIDEKQIENILVSHKDIFEGKYLIAIPVDEDLSKISWNSQDHVVRKSFYQKANIFFSANKNTIDFGLGKKSDSIDSFLDEFKSLKPCLFGSDAHKLESICVFPNKKNCWIKADPTFEGLKQIIYEPETRVKIQENKPESKLDYKIIDSISFDNEEMGKQTILFNQNLNTIIGGRSSGKSILLGCLAHKIDKFKKVKIDNDKYNEKIEKLSENQKVIVTWRDNSEDNTDRDVRYCSQSEISELCRKKENGLTGVDEIIDGIIRKESEYKILLDNYDSFIDNNKNKINKNINDFILKRNRIKDLSKEIQTIGNKEGVKISIEKIELEIKELKKGIDSAFSPEDKANYEKQKDTLKTNKQTLEKNEIYKSLLESIKSQSIINPIDSFLAKTPEKIHAEVSSFYNELKTRVDIEWNTFFAKKINVLDTENNELKTKNNEIENDKNYKKGKKIESENVSFIEKEKLLEQEQNKLAEINKKQTEKEFELKQKDATKEEILNAFNDFYLEAKKIAEKIKYEKDDVKISCLLNCNYEQFNNVEEKWFNKKTGEGNTYLSKVDYDETTFQNIVYEIFEKIDSEKILIKGNIQQAYISLFTENYYNLSFDVLYDSDKLSEMSEGKKAFIVLRLLLDFDDSSCPILIDQPEDDLDNRAIYDDLVKYLRNKKQIRQIILVTHNPNIVVGADSELVIVANQNGVKNINSFKEGTRERLQFQYYGNSIENTFRNEQEKFVLLSRGIREHICEILEGGEKAFEIREKKYGYK